MQIKPSPLLQGSAYCLNTQSGVPSGGLKWPVWVSHTAGFQGAPVPIHPSARHWGWEKRNRGCEAGSTFSPYSVLQRTCHNPTLKSSASLLPIPLPNKIEYRWFFFLRMTIPQELATSILSGGGERRRGVQTSPQNFLGSLEPHTVCPCLLPETRWENVPALRSRFTVWPLDRSRNNQNNETDTRGVLSRGSEVGDVKWWRIFTLSEMLWGECDLCPSTFLFSLTHFYSRFSACTSCSWNPIIASRKHFYIRQWKESNLSSLELKPPWLWLTLPVCMGPVLSTT